LPKEKAAPFGKAIDFIGLSSCIYKHKKSIADMTDLSALDHHRIADLARTIALQLQQQLDTLSH